MPSTATEDQETAASGGRVRKTTQRLGFEAGSQEEEPEFQPPVGAGTKLSEMEDVAERIAKLGKKDAETLKVLYNIMYGRRFQLKKMKVIKEHILEFSGIPGTDEKAREQLNSKLGRWMRSFLEYVMDLLGIDRSKKSFDEEGSAYDKEALMKRLEAWLFEPKETAGVRRKSKKSKSATKRSPSAADAKKSPKARATGTKRKPTASKEPARKRVKTAPVVEDEGDSTESEGEGAEDTIKKAQTKPEPKPKPKVSDKVKASPKSKSKEPLDADVSPVRGEQAKEKSPDSLDQEVCDTVKNIIEHGDAEQLTIKTIVRQASEELGRDLSSQKGSIKQFVRQL